MASELERAIDVAEKKLKDIKDDLSMEDVADKFKRVIKNSFSEAGKDVGELDKKLNDLALAFKDNADKAGAIKEALDITKQMRDNKVASDELVKSLEAIGKNPLDYSGKLTDMMKELQKEMRDVQNASDPAKINKLVEEYKELAKTKESLEGLEKAIRGIGAALGVALPQLKTLEIVMFIAQTVFEWSENSAKVNKQMYEIGANLGHMGEMAGIATGEANALAWQFGVTTEEVRNTEIGLTKIGARMEDVGELTKNQLALSKLWSEYTPQEQTRIMSVYMKEFGLSGKDAQGVMLGIVDLANNLKKVMPELDIKTFASQVQDVAISMRKYGLETSDAIALTGTLTKLGIDQARIPELAKAMGGFAMSDPALGVVAMDAYVATLEKEEDEYKKLISLQKDGGKELDDLQKKRLQQLQEERVHRQGLIEDVKSMDILEKASYINTLKGGEAIKANFAGMTAMLKEVTGETYATIDAAKAMTLSKLRPDFFPMGIPGTEAFFKAREEFKEPLAPLKEGATAKEKEAYGEQIKLRELVSEAGGVGSERGVAILMEQVQKDLSKGETKEEERTTAAKQIALDTTKSRESIDIIKGIIGDWYRHATGAAGQEATLRRMARTGTTIDSVEEGISMGLTEESSKKLLGIQERAKSQAKLAPAEVEAKRQSEMASELSAWWKPNRFKIPLQEKVETEKIEDMYAQKLREKEEAKEKAAEASKPALPYSGFFPQYASQQTVDVNVTVGIDKEGEVQAFFNTIKRKN